MIQVPSVMALAHIKASNYKQNIIQTYTNLPSTFIVQISLFKLTKLYQIRIFDNLGLIQILCKVMNVIDVSYITALTHVRARTTNKTKFIHFA